MRIHGLRTCDTCRKTAKALPRAEFVDIRETPPDTSLLNRALDAFGARLVNTRSTTWRGLSEAERRMDPQDLIRAHPAVMKRPLIEAGADLHLGWTPEVRRALGVD